MKRFATYIVFFFVTLATLAQSDVDTQRMYLSGHGCDDMVKWDFLCTGGQNSGKCAFSTSAFAYDGRDTVVGKLDRYA